MDRRPGKSSDPSRRYDMQIGTSTAVLNHAFVAESLRREKQKVDGFGAVRGIMNGLLIGAFFWIVVGLVLFALS